jgi:hypothetical protein
MRKGVLKKLGTFINAGLVVIGTIGLFIYEAESQLDVSASVQITAPADFYQPLGTCGSWVDAGAYGHCFRPARVDADWRPYCAGSWVWTDCGWYWQSDEPWAWACYHYGTWVDDAANGWIWVPGTAWAPAWVTWRTGGSFVGWAPCAPSGGTVAPALFVFVDVNHFQDPVRRTAVTVNNATAISQTRVLAAPDREQRTIGGRAQEVIVNRGPDVEAVQRASGRIINQVPIGEAMQKTVMPGNLGPQNRTTEPGDLRQPVAPGRDQPAPALDRQNDNTPARQPDITPQRPEQRPEETRQPSLDSPERAPAPEAPTTVPKEEQQPPRDWQVPSKEQQKPAGPPKEEQPPPEQKPANPPPEQEKKDSLGKSSSMLAMVLMAAPAAGMS